MKAHVIYSGIIATCAVGLVLFGSGFANATNLVQNHGFELPGAQTAIPAGDTTSIPNWAAPPTGTFGAGQGTSEFGGIIVAADFFDLFTDPFQGSWSYNIGQGNGSAGVYQDIPTDVGQKYYLSFWAAGAKDEGDDGVNGCDPTFGSCTNNGVVSAGPAAGNTRADLDEVFSLTEGGEPLWRLQDYEKKEYTFTASSTLTRLSFYSPGWEDVNTLSLDNSIYQGSITIDDVVLQIPEPASIALAGLGVVMLYGRRRTS